MATSPSHSRSLFSILVLSCLFLVPHLFAFSRDKTSTPEERATWPVITHKLEADPLDPDLQKQGEHAAKRISDVNDFHVLLCVGFVMELRALHYEYAPQIWRQYLLATTSYEVEHSMTGDEKTFDLNAINVFALESVLKVYSNLLCQAPKSHSHYLDDLLKKQSEGKLPDAVAKTCKVKPH